MKTSSIPILLLAAACAHGEPFSASDPTLDAPLVAGEPLRLTFADGGPTAPAWVPQSDSLVYSYTRRGGGFLIESEGCLAVLPASGGSIRREICSRSVFTSQSGDFFDLPAVSEGRRLAFMHDGQPAAGGAIAEAILAASFDDPSGYTVVQSFPFLADDFFLAPDDLQWLDESTVIFLGLVDEQLPPPCEACQPVLVRYPRAVIAVAGDGSGNRRVIPGTLSATSVTRGESSDVIYYTLGGDAKLYRQELSSGTVTIAHDFGAPVVARGVHFAGGRLVAMIDGRFQLDSTSAGTAQTAESGGALVVVVPGGGTIAVATASPMWFRRPALSEDGTAIVAEGERLQLNPIAVDGEIVGYDTIPGVPAIWRIAVP